MTEHLNFLSGNQVVALNSVNLKIVGITHGVPTYSSRLGREYIRGVTSYDYQQAESAIEELNHERGDVLALERESFIPTGNPRTYQDTLYGDVRPVPVSQFTEQEVAEIKDRLVVDTERRIHDPFDYATGLALLRGVEVQFADADYSQLIQASLRRRNKLLGLLRHGNEISRGERELAMLLKLGEIASGMIEKPYDRTDPPQLTFIVGTGHLCTLPRHLRTTEIDFTTNRHPFSAAYHADL